MSSTSSSLAYMHTHLISTAPLLRVKLSLKRKEKKEEGVCKDGKDTLKGIWGPI